MTQPDQSVPDDSVTDAAGAGLAAFAATTQEQWEDSIWSPETSRWGTDGLLGYLFTGLSQGKNFVVALIEALIHAAFDTVTDVFTTVESAVESFASNFSGKWYDIVNAQDAADYANAQLAALNQAMSDLFDVYDLTGLGSDWDTDRFGTFGAGLVYRDDTGNANWAETGGQTYTELDRYNAATTASDYQIITIVVPIPPQDPVLGEDSYIYMLGRVANTGDVSDDCVAARIGNNDLAIGYFSSGTWTELTSVAYTKAYGDTWKFHLGSNRVSTTNDYEFILYRNGVEMLSYDDSSSPVTQMGASYRSVGFGMRAGARLLFLFQTSPGTIAVWSADEPDWGS